MEEKERYVKYDPDNDDIITRTIYDTIEKKPIIVTADRCIDLLNQQYKRIKELEEENGYVLFEDGYDENGNEINKQVYTTYKEEFVKLVLDNKKLRKENQQLKQQLEEKEKEIRQLDNEKGMLLNNSMKLLKEKDDKLHDLPKKIVGEIREKVCEHSFVTDDYNLGEINIKTLTFTRILDTILRKYGGGK